jgi:hypothetical protein
MINDYGAGCGMRIKRDVEMLGENLPSSHVVHHKLHMISVGIEPGPSLWKARD